MVQYGVQIEAQFGFNYEHIIQLALLSEEMGFGSIWCSDHFFLDNNSSEQDCWECWTLLSAIAIETNKIRIGPLVSCISYRHPALLAKIAACVDHLSGGRLDFGIGAGWKKLEYDAYGIPFPSASERVKRLEEGLQIIKKLWTQHQTDFQGTYYKVSGAYSSPKPVQKPHPPIWIGGERQKMMDIAARFADAINIGSHPSLAKYKNCMKILEKACQKHGRDFKTIKKSHFFEIAIASDTRELDNLLRDLASRAGKSFETFRSEYGGYVGTPKQISDYLKQFIDIGVEQFIFVFPYGHEEASIRLLSEHVLHNV